MAEKAPKISPHAPAHKQAMEKRSSFIHRKGEDAFFSPSHSRGQVATPVFIQPKLQISRPDDPFEQEADQNAEKVMRMHEPAASPSFSSTPSQEKIQTKCSKCEEEEKVQKKEEEEVQPKLYVNNTGSLIQREEQDDVQTRRIDSDSIQRREDDNGAAASHVYRSAADINRETQEEDVKPKLTYVAREKDRGPPAISPSFENNLHNNKGSGRPMDSNTLQFMESRFYADFSGVKVHTDARAGDMCSEIHAQAFTHGRDIYFNSGYYNPGNGAGKHLLAHELTHVLQQRKGETVRKINRKATAPAIETHTSVCDQYTVTPVDNLAASSTAGSEGLSESSTVAEASPPSPSPLSIPVKGVAVKQPAKDENLPAPANPSAGKDAAFEEIISESRKAAKKQKKHDEPEMKAAEAEKSSEVKGEVDIASAQTYGARVFTADEKVKTEPKEFTAEAFKIELREEIKKQFPNTKDEYNKFDKANSIQGIKSGTSEKIDKSQKEVVSSAAAISSTGTIDTSKKDQIYNQETKSSDPENAGPKPVTGNIARAIPKPVADESIKMDEEHDADSLDRLMVQNNITDSQLAESEEPSFEAALTEKQKSQEGLCAHPAKLRSAEQIQLQRDANITSKVFNHSNSSMNEARKSEFDGVQLRKNDAKSHDETLLSDYYSAIKNIFECTERRVNAKLEGLDEKVSDIFQAAVDTAYQQFKDNVSEGLDDYYGADLLVITVSNEDQESDDMSKMLNAVMDREIFNLQFKMATLKIDDPERKRIQEKIIFLQGKKRKLIIDTMFENEKNTFISSLNTAIDTIADLVANTLNDAKKLIAQGKADIECENSKLPEHLKEEASEATIDFTSRFDDLSKTINEKQSDLVATISKQYTDSVSKLKETFEQIRVEESMKLWERAWRKIKDIATVIYDLGKTLLNILAKAAGVIGDIIAHPIRFFGNLIEGVTQGFGNFIKRLPKHLEDIIFKLILGTVPPGLAFPDKWDEKGILSFVLGIFGLSKENIRKQAVDRFGEPVVEKLEKGFDLFVLFKNEGFAGLWHHIEDKIGDLKGKIIEQIKTYFKEAIVEAAIKFLLSALTPASGFIAVCRMIVSVVTFFVKNLQNILKLLDSILDSMADIAANKIDKAALKVETALADILLIGIKFLAALVGINLDKIQAKISRIIDAVKNPVNRALKWLFDKAEAFAKKTGLLKLAEKGKAKFEAGKDWAKKKAEQGKEVGKKALAKFMKWLGLEKSFAAEDGKVHKLYFTGSEDTPVLTVASNPTPFASFIEMVDPGKEQRKIDARGEALGIAKKIDKRRLDPLPGNTEEEKAASREDKLKDVQGLLSLLSKPTAVLFGDNSEMGKPEIEHRPASPSKTQFGTYARGYKLFKGRIPSGSGPVDSAHDIYDILDMRRMAGGSSYYIRGHLLNENLGGVGKWHNLTPLSREGNHQHESEVESTVKAAVDSGAPVEYIIQPVYINRGDTAAIKAEFDKKADPQAEIKKKIVDAENKVPDALTCEAYILEATDGKISQKQAIVKKPVNNPIDRNPDHYFLSGEPPRSNIYLNKATASSIASIDEMDAPTASKIELAHQKLRLLEDRDAFSTYEELSDARKDRAHHRIFTTEPEQEKVLKLKKKGYVKLYAGRVSATTTAAAADISVT